MENKYDTKEIDSNFNISYDKFTVYVNRTFLGSVFNESKKVFKNKHELSKYIIKKYNLKRYNARNLAETFTRRWINGMRSIPLDYLLALCEIAKKDKKEIYKNILSIKFAGCRIPIEIKKFPLKLNTHWAFISECIRCEGALDGKRMTLENTSTEIISEFRNNLYQIGVGNENIKEHISVKVQVPNDLEKNDIKVFNSKGEMRNFHMRVLNLRKGIKKEIIFTDKFKYEKNLNYQILTKTNKININVLIPKYGKIEAVSDYSDKRYKNVSPSVVLVVCNKTAVWILNNIFEIPLGKKSSIIRIPEIIKNISIWLTAGLFGLVHFYLFLILPLKEGIIFLCIIALAGACWGYMFNYFRN
ncbi:MAG: CPBP family intramembrane metalloprotease, partial [Nanoarchaeota archaeon]|nr:CPBP family intramembrane metalloprotease [Nanoarchaeota archaeon]